MLYVAIAVTSVTTLLIFMRTKLKKTKAKALVSSKADAWNYAELKNLISNNTVSLPTMIVDLDAFEANVRQLVHVAHKHGKKLRIATKSIRCLELIKRIGEMGGQVVSGYMCYAVAEAEFLYKEGLDDFYIAYPTVQPSDIKLAMDMTRKGAIICLTVDSVEQIERLNDLLSGTLQDESGNNLLLKVSIDLDMSYKIGPLHLGAHRSSVGSVRRFDEVCTGILKSKYLKLWGVMGYEASVAGLPDDNPHSPLPNPVIRYGCDL